MKEEKQNRSFYESKEFRVAFDLIFLGVNEEEISSEEQVRSTDEFKACNPQEQSDLISFFEGFMERHQDDREELETKLREELEFQIQHCSSAQLEKIQDLFIDNIVKLEDEQRRKLWDFLPD